MKIRKVTYESIRHALKLSKAGSINEEPYEVERLRGDNWWTVTNRHGTPVAQMSDAQIQEAIQ